MSAAHLSLAAGIRPDPQIAYVTEQHAEVHSALQQGSIVLTQQGFLLNKQELTTLLRTWVMA